MTSTSRQTKKVRPAARFKNWIFHLDQILRGEATRPTALQGSEIRIPVLGITALLVILAMVYGFCMGIFSLVHGFETDQFLRAFQQTTASMCKVPLLFVLTLTITFPSLYVFNALVGSQLKVIPVLKLLLASMAVNMTVLASLGPILAFFSVSTPNYAFIVLLNVAVFTVAGLLGLGFLIQTLSRLDIRSSAERTSSSRSISGPSIPSSIPPSNPSPASMVSKPPLAIPAAPLTTQTGPLDSPSGAAPNRNVKNVFACWLLLYGVVGAQMGWVLRPFIGSPNRPFSWFRARDSNFFESVLNSLQNLLF